MTVSAVRQRIETALNAHASFRRSRFSPTLSAMDPRGVLTGAFAVETQSTEAHPADRRQKVSAGLMVNTYVNVSVVAKNRATGQVGDYDAMLALEATAITVVEGISRADLHILFDRADRETADKAEFYITTIRFRVIHRLALQ